MITYNSSICSTCRYLADCALTMHKGFITCCSEYEHVKQHASRSIERVEEEDSYEELIFI